MAFHIRTVHPPVVVQPPDNIVIANTEGLGTWTITRPEAIDLYHALGKELGIELGKELGIGA